MAALEEAVTEQTCAVLLEAVQGEGGARALPEADLVRLRELCTEKGVLLILDEIQCGLGRTGKLFAYEWAQGVTPDILCIAKALGDGFPVGACLATAEAGKGMKVGSHGSTYGGNPLAMAVGLASLEELTKPETLANVRDITGYFAQQLSGLKDRFPDVIEDIRGKGLLIGLKLKTPNRDFMALARDQKLLIAGGGDNCVRLLPMLLLTPRRGARGDGEAGTHLRGCEIDGGGRMTNSLRRVLPDDPELPMARPRSFIDLWSLEAADLRAIMKDAHRRKAARVGWPKGRADADAPLRDRTLAMVFQKNSTRTWFLVRRGDPPARRLFDHLHRRRHAAGPRRDHRRHRPGPLAHGRCDHDPRQPPRGRAGAGGDG